MWAIHEKKKKGDSKLNSIKIWIKENCPDFLDNYDFQDIKDLKIVLSFIEDQMILKKEPLKVKYY